MSPYFSVDLSSNLKSNKMSTLNNILRYEYQAISGKLSANTPRLDRLTFALRLRVGRTAIYKYPK
jgi:hypothetical protein